MFANLFQFAAEQPKQLMKRRRSLSMDLADSILVERSPTIDGVSLVNAHAVGRRAPDDLVELAKEIQLADNTIKTTAVEKLRIIAEQMQFLQSQARRVLEEARVSQNLNHAHCNFKRIPGHTYHLYSRPSGQTYFSMIAPKEWGTNGAPHKHLGSYRLEQDKSWTPVDEIKKKDELFAPFNKLVNGLDAITYPSDNRHMDTD